MCNQGIGKTGRQRARVDAVTLDPNVFRTSDIHLHIPAGAIPKDGPSAGITMATAVASLFLKKPVRPYLGMTGEITLRGRVLPIGGLKEKVLAAARFGIKTVVIPKLNEADLDDVPDTVRESLEFILVDTVDEVLDAALGIQIDATFNGAESAAVESAAVESTAVESVVAAD